MLHNNRGRSNNFNTNNELGQDTDANGNNPVLRAAAAGQAELLIDLTKSKRKGGFNLPIKAKNNNGNNALLMAVSNNRIPMVKLLVAKKKNGGFGLSPKVKNNFGSGAVLLAIGSGYIEMLQFLTAPVKDGGLGLPINVLNNNNYDPLDMATVCEQTEMLEILTHDKADGGYGFILDDAKINELLDFAKENSCGKSVFWLIQYEFNRRLKSSGHAHAIKWVNDNVANLGELTNEVKPMLFQQYTALIKALLEKPELSVEEFSDLELLIPAAKTVSVSKSLFLVNMVVEEFNQKLDNKGCAFAVDWALSFISALSFMKSETPQAELQRVFCDRLFQLINEYSSLPKQKLSDIKKLINAVEILSPGEGAFFYAKKCMDMNDFKNAYTCYSSAYKNILFTDNKKKMDAGFELANFILNKIVPAHVKGRARINEAQKYLHKSTQPEALELQSYLDRKKKGDVQLKNYSASVSASKSTFFSSKKMPQVHDASLHETVKMTY